MEFEKIKDGLRHGIAERLRGELEKRGWGAIDLAREIGMTRAAVGRWVPKKGPALSLPGAAEVLLICLVLGLSADWLLGKPKKSPISKRLPFKRR